MPQLLSLDYVLLLISGAFALWEIYSLMRTRGRILLEGKPFGRMASSAIIAALSALALWRSRNALGAIWLDAAAIAAALALFTRLKAGLGEKGIFYIGRYYPYAKLQHYQIDRETEKTFGLRATNGVKEFVIDFPVSHREVVIAHMIRAGVPDLNAIKGKKA